jgi:hypothetical protein
VVVEARVGHVCRLQVVVDVGTALVSRGHMQETRQQGRT